MRSNGVLNVIFFFFFDLEFTTLSKIVHLHRVHRSSKVGENRRTRRFQYVVIGYKDTYFVRDHSDAPQKYADADVIKMLEYLINYILWRSADVSKQSVYRWVLTVHRCLPNCFYTRMRRSLYKFSPSRQETPCTTIHFHLQI